MTEIATTGTPPGMNEPLLSGSDAALGLAYREAQQEGPGAVQELAKGTRLGERYEIVGTLGRGGMGIVYEACNANVEHIRYAIKTLLPGQPQADAAHFIQEAKRASKVRSPHVVKIFDFGVDAASGLTYMVMDYIGEDLDKYTRRHGNALPPAQAVDFCIQVCEALVAAHAEGVVHRDIKPLNCLLRMEGGHETVVVTDFGIARDIFSAPVPTGEAAGLDSAWTTVGTPGYIAPEVWLREARADHRIDIYSVGAMLFRLLSGKTPPLAPRSEELNVSAIPEALRPVLHTALARAPKDRYPSARALQAALREALPASQTPAIAAAQPRLRGLVITLVLLIVAVAAVSISLLLRRETEAPTVAVRDATTTQETLSGSANGASISPPPAQTGAERTRAPADPVDVTLTTGAAGEQVVAPPTKPPDSVETPNPAPKPRLAPLFATKQADFTAALRKFCQAKDGVLACVDQLKLKRTEEYKTERLETMLYFKFSRGTQYPSLTSRHPRLDLKNEAKFKTCVEAKLRTWGRDKLIATRDGGEVSCAVAL